MVAAKPVKLLGKAVKIDNKVRNVCCCNICACEDENPLSPELFSFFDDDTACNEIANTLFDDTGAVGSYAPSNCTPDAAPGDCEICVAVVCEGHEKLLSESDCRFLLEFHLARCKNATGACEYQLKIDDVGFGCFSGFCPLITNEGVWLDPISCECDQSVCGRCVAIFGPFELSSDCGGLSANCNDCYDGEFYVAIYCLLPTLPGAFGPEPRFNHLGRDMVGYWKLEGDGNDSAP